MNDVLQYTPRCLAVCVQVAAKRERRNLAIQLEVMALAAQGDKKAINKRIKELSK